MGDGGLKNIIIGLVLFVGFTMIILTVAVDFGAEYGKSADEIGDGSLNLVGYEAVANSIEGNTSAMRSSFESGDVDDIDDASGMFGTIKKFINLITAPFSLLSSVLVNLLNFPKLIIDIILGLLSVSLIFGMWRVLRAGS